MADKRFCTFDLDHLWFGVAIERVQEVVASPAITPVPLAPRAVAGLINLRGQIVTVISPRHRLGFEERPAPALRATVVVVRSEKAAIGLLVDDIGEVVEAPECAFAGAPDNLPPGPRELVPRVCQFPGRLLHVLDLDRVLGGDGTELESGKTLKQTRDSAD
jgi:purine-binding chemotaxis protein CheW